MALLIVFIEAFINVLAQALTLAIFARVILSWVPVRLPWGLGEFVFAVSEPILAPIRRALPPMSGIDLSPLVVWLVVIILLGFLRQFQR